MSLAVNLDATHSKRTRARIAALVPLLSAAVGCSSSGPPSPPLGPRMDQQIEFRVDRGGIANHSASGEVPAVQYLPSYQIKNKGGRLTYRLTTTPLGPGGEAYEDVEGRISPSRTLLEFGTVSAGELVRDFNSVRPRPIAYRLRLDVTFSDGSTGFSEGENVLVDVLPPRPLGFVISQIRLVGAAGAVDQFVELRNGSNQPVNLFFWTLDSWSATGEMRIRIAVRFPSLIVPPGCHFLVTPSRTSRTAEGVARDGVLLHELPLDGGLALRGLSGQVIDQVGFHSASIFKEGAPLAPLLELRNRSHVRVSDTANNASDFMVSDSSRPRNLSDCGA